MRYTVDTAIKNLGNTTLLWSIVKTLQPYIDHLHFSTLGIMTQNLVQPKDAKDRLAAFVNTFPDQQPTYKAAAKVKTAAKLFGYNGKTTYSMTDLDFIEQSEAVCKWSTRP